MTESSPLSPETASAWLDDITTIVSRAGAAILAVTDLATRTKPDQSPLTAADEAAQGVILAGLADLGTGLPIVSEEALSRVPAALGDAFFLVDPIDGTRELVEGRDEYTVNIAVVSAGRPLLGVIAAPARGALWRGVVGRGAEAMTLAPGAGLAAAQDRRAIRTRRWPAAPTALVSRSHLDPASAGLLDRLGVTQRQGCGSSLKFCLIAEGRADLYPRLGPTSEWDIAAGEALVAAAGGCVVAPDGGALRYGTRAQGFRVGGFVAWGDPGRAGGTA